MGLVSLPFKSLADLASFLALLATVLFSYFRVWGSERDAFEQVRRCKHLQRLISKKAPPIREALVSIARCLSRKADEPELEEILYEDTNLVEELRDFAENPCPDLDVSLRRRARNLGFLGVAYIIIGFLSGDYLIALTFSLLGFVPMVWRERESYRMVRDFTIELDEIEDKIKSLEERFDHLQNICRERVLRRPPT